MITLPPSLYLSGHHTYHLPSDASALITTRTTCHTYSLLLSSTATDHLLSLTITTVLGYPLLPTCPGRRSCSFRAAAVTDARHPRSAALVTGPPASLTVASQKRRRPLPQPPGAGSPGVLAAPHTRGQLPIRAGPNGRLRCGPEARPEPPILWPPTHRLRHGPARTADLTMLLRPAPMAALAEHRMSQLTLPREMQNYMNLLRPAPVLACKLSRTPPPRKKVNYGA